MDHLFHPWHYAPLLAALPFLICLWRRIEGSVSFGWSKNAGLVCSVLGGLLERPGVDGDDCYGRSSVSRGSAWSEKCGKKGADGDV